MNKTEEEQVKAATRRLLGPCGGGHCKGANMAELPHSCPFQSEINDDDNPNYCTCCASCEWECAMDI